MLLIDGIALHAADREDCAKGVFLLKPLRAETEDPETILLGAIKELQGSS